MRESLESVAAERDFFHHCRDRKEERIGQEPSPRGTLRGKNDCDAAKDRERQDAGNGGAPADGHSQTRFCLPARPQGQPLLRDWMFLPVEDATECGEAEEKDQEKDGLFGEG